MTRAARPWTTTDDDAVRDAWATPDPVWMIAKELNRSTVAIYSRAKTLGLPPKITPPQPKGYRGPSKAGTTPVQYPAPRQNRDEDHVAACLDQGGFVTAVRIDGKTVHIKPRIAA